MGGESLLKQIGKKLASAAYWVIPIFFTYYLLGPVIIASTGYSRSFTVAASVIFEGVFYALPWFLGGGIVVSLLRGKAKRLAQITLGSLFLITFGIMIFYPYAGGQFDGTARTALDFKLLFGSYAAIFGVLVILGLFRNTVFRKLYAAGIIAALLIFSYSFVVVTSGQGGEMEGTTDVLIRFNELGKKRNFIFIVLDGMQGELVKRTLEQYPEQKDNFPGFTLFYRATANFPFTNYSVPCMLNGKMYPAQDKTFKSNLACALEDSFVTDSRKLGYRPSVLATRGMPVGIPRTTVYKYVRQGVENPYTAYYETFLTMTRLRLLKTTMSFSKLLHVALNKLHMGGVADLLPKEAHPPYDRQTVHKADSAEALRLWAEALHFGPDDSKFLFMYNMLTHPPLMFDSKGKRIPEDTYSMQAAIEEMRFTGDRLALVFDKLKQLGVYDETTIILTADHGSPYNCLPEDYAPGYDFQAQVVGNNFKPAGIYNPAVMIKPPHSNTFQMTDDPLALIDMREIVNAYLDASPGMPVRKLVSEIRKRNSPYQVMTNARTVGADELGLYADEHVIHLIEGNVTAIPELLVKISKTEN